MEAVLRNNSGFSLVELIMVMVTVAIIAAIAAPRYALASSRYRAEAAARRIVEDLRLARNEARKTSASRMVVFDITGDQLMIKSIAGLDDPSATYTTQLSAPPYQAEIIEVTFPGNILVFDGFGQPSSSGKISVKVGKTVREITLDGATGEVQVQ